DGQDVYKLRGSGRSSINVRIIGGPGYDQFTRTDSVPKGYKILMYESKDTAIKPLYNRGTIRTRSDQDTALHAYAYDSFVYDRKGILFNLNYGMDRGLILGLGYLIENQGFRKKPYAYRHEILANYLTERESFMLSYSGIFKELVGKHD